MQRENFHEEGGYQGSEYLLQDDERLQESGSIVEGFWRGRGWSFVEREGSQGRGGASGAGGGQPYVPPRRWLTGSFKLTICFTLSSS